MTTRRMICIECPVGCALSVDVENCRVTRVSGNKCPKGEGYAVSEVEHPVRTLTSAVLTKGLKLKMAPVRTDKAIPKDKLKEAMEEIRKARLDRPLKCGEPVVKDFLGLGVDLVVTRDVG